MRKTLQKILALFLFSFLLFNAKAYAQDKSDVAIKYIQINAVLFHLNNTDVADVRMIDEDTDNKTGMTHVYLSQFYKGVNIYNAVARIHINSHNDVVYYNSSF